LTNRKKEASFSSHDFPKNNEEKMMLEAILQQFIEEAQAKIAELQRELGATLDIAAFEQGVKEILDKLAADIEQCVLEELLADLEVLNDLKRVGGKLALRYKEYREVSIVLAHGQVVTVRAPYFVKAQPKGNRRRKKRGPNGTGCYLGLEVLGFIEKRSPILISEVVKVAVLSPSLEVAQEMLAGRGIDLDVKTIRQMCSTLGAMGIARRGQVSLAGGENLAGHTLVIGIDGGRLRERRRKRGRKKEGQKRQGYHTDWREPKLFTLYLVDAQGEVVKPFDPLHDATMGNHVAMFALLENYLMALDLSTVSRIVFCGDGAPWIWSDVETLCRTLGLEQLCPVYQVLDYTHAKQNLQDIINLLPRSLKGKPLAQLAKEWKTLLWTGDIQGLYTQIIQYLKGNKKKQALKKWRDFFANNQQRMQYATFHSLHIPCGSGCVESAIRRIINLRLKSAGTFWTKPMAECFLFLRSQLLSGRWSTVLRNITREKALTLLNLESA
jgi:hypothetical protein